jgi:hypothetical protein
MDEIRQYNRKNKEGAGFYASTVSRGIVTLNSQSNFYLTTK